MVGINMQKFFDGGLTLEADLLIQASVAKRFQLLSNGKDTDIYFAYDERLKSLAEWGVSITAESLGKSGKGITPIASVGSRDNHSTLQFYLQGPRDKMTYFMSLSDTDPQNLHSLEAVKKAYEDEKLPYTHIELDASTPDKLAYDLGCFMQAKMIETVLLAGFMGVNPYDQPGVELYKKYLNQ
jgi:glucose-6-phosphate isomerase